MFKFIAYSIYDLIRNVDDRSNQKSYPCSSSLTKFDNERWTADFTTTCGSGNTWQERIIFLDAFTSIPLEDHSKVDSLDKLIQLYHDKVVYEGDVLLACNCPAQKYFYQYILDQLESSITPEGRFPTIRNPNLDGLMCKHLVSVLRRFLL